MKLHLNVDTPEQCRAEIIKWLNYQATLKHSQARLASRKTAKSNFILQAETFEFAAKSIQEMVINS